MESGKSHYLEGVINQRKKAVLLSVTQPMTATQLSRKLGLSLDQCSDALLALQSHKLIRCLNPTAARNRLFWLTSKGKKDQHNLNGKCSLSYYCPNIDWDLYASVCFSQRSEVIKTLTFPMQPAKIKRRATFRKPGLRLSANNVRDVIRYLKTHWIVRPVKLGKKAHPGYELTDIGLHMRRLLLQAEVRA